MPYDVRDNYGRKVGTITENNDGAIIGCLLFLVFSGLFWLIGKLFGWAKKNPKAALIIAGIALFIFLANVLNQAIIANQVAP